MDQNNQTKNTNASMQNSKPSLSAYALDSLKLKLLQNPREYEELSKAVEDRNHKKGKRRDYIIWGCTYAIVIVCALVAYLKGYPNLGAGIILLSTFFPFIPAGLWFLFDAIIPKIKDPDSFRIEDWTWVRLTDEDKENYKRYITACDEYDNISYPISWNEVTFQDGYVEVDFKKRKTVVRYTCNSKSVYSTCKSVLQKHFGEVVIEAKDGRYVIKNPSVIEDSILIIIRYLELLEKERRERIAAIVNNNPEILDARKNQQTIIITIKALKSDYLNHLLKYQVSDISVISTLECCSYATSTNVTYERAYVFALKNSKGKYCVIYESAVPDNASIVAIVDDEEQFYKCAVSMVKYMRSRAVNKRDTLRKTHKINDFKVSSIDHKDIAKWKSNVTGDYFVRKTKRSWYR